MRSTVRTTWTVDRIAKPRKIANIRRLEAQCRQNTTAEVSLYHVYFELKRSWKRFGIPTHFLQTANGHTVYVAPLCFNERDKTEM